MIEHPLKSKVLFLCTGNSARSQMAEAFLRHYASDRYEVFSAGIDARGINPYTIKVMEELGFSLKGHSSKNISLYFSKTQFDVIITVCSDAEKRCPFFPGQSVRIHWPFEDPAAFQGSEEEITEKFREVRDQIRSRIKEWLHEQGIPTTN